MGFVQKNGTFREVAEATTRAGPPRICMPTLRNFTKRPFRCGLYEAQDVLVDIDDVDLISIDGDTSQVTWLKQKWQKNTLRDKVFRKLSLPDPRLRKVQLNRDYDAFIAVCNLHWDLSYIDAIKRWRDHCKISVCWIEEIWAAEIPDDKYLHHLLSQFDYVFTNARGSVSALSQAINRPCYWLPIGIDTLRFSPFPDSPARVIDVYSIGRRYEGIHLELSGAAERDELFYVHDTLMNAADIEVYNHRQHRELLANMAKRSRYFMVAAPKMDSFNETRGQVEIGSRYFEGAAAGAVMIGDAPDCEAYRELYGWPEAVIQIQPDGSNVMAVLSDLGSDPKRMAAISRRNAKEALLRHDWVYRWKEMFRVAGIEPSPRMAARERCLKGMADFATGVNESDATRDGG